MLDYEALSPAVDKAAYIAASKFPDHHDINDVKQTLWVWVMEQKNTVSRVISEADHPAAVLEPLLVKAAMTFLRVEDADAYGYDEQDIFNYSTDMIKNILEVVFSHEDWQSLAQAVGDGMPRQKSEPALGGNNLASYADVSRVLPQLPDDQYNLLIWRYKYRYTFQRIGDESEVTKRTAQNRHRAALNGLQQLLGKKDLARFRSGHSGRTEARNSVSGQARVERDYEG
jgi:DNA-directed RNA polymerase specialized sigma24 family protein